MSSIVDTPDVSVIIVSWNAKQHLLNCLSSLVDTTDGYSNEIIIVDNASSDGSPDAVASEFPEVTLIRNHGNLGFAKANNIGIRRSSGRFLCILNSDVIVRNGCIKNLMAFMDENPNVGVSGPKILNRDCSLQVQCRRFPTIWNNLCQALGFNKLFPRSAFFSEPFMKYWAHDEVREVDVITGCFWMVRREAIEEVGLLDEVFFIYGEDIDWCKRFHEAGWDVVFYPGAEAMHVGGASSANAPINFFIEIQKADFLYWKKHHGTAAAFVYRMIVLLRHVLRVIARASQYLFCPSQRRILGFKLRRSAACVRWALHILD